MTLTVGCLEVCTSTIHCGSEPARDGGGSVGLDVGWTGVIASRLAPTGFGGMPGWCGSPRSNVGASLLAMAVGLLASMLNGLASSRAGSLPTGFGGMPGWCGSPRSNVGASLLAMAVGLLVSMLDGLASSRAGSLPTGFGGMPEWCGSPRSSVGASLLAMAVGLLASMLDGLASSRASPASTGFGDVPESTIQCGSEPARDGGGSVGIDVGWAGVIAGKPGSHRGRWCFLGSKKTAPFGAVHLLQDAYLRAASHDFSSSA